MAKIVINHLGAIKHVDMDIKQFNLLIGEQATGKSTLCKAIYYFRNVKEILINYFYDVSQYGENDRSALSEVNSKLKDSFVKLFGYSWQLPDDLSMEYYYTDDCYIKLNLRQKRKKYISIEHSKALKKAIELLNEEAIRIHDTKIDSAVLVPYIENRAFFNYLDNQISKILDDDMTTYYIPAGRGLLSLLCNQKTYLNYGELDPLNRKFMQTIEALQPKFADGISNVHNYFPKGERKFDIRQMANVIVDGMKGEYFYQKGREFLQIENSNEKVAINFASSGQQEMLWLYNQLYVLMLKEEKAFVIIEEPEAHLYPALQKNILDFIVMYMNITGSNVIITTHSPYLLTASNNLYLMGKLRNDGKQKDVEKIAGRWRFIDPLNVNAYKLTNDRSGTDIRSLIDEDTKELMASEIDEISKEINEVYTTLYYLEEGFEVE